MAHIITYTHDIHDKNQKRKKRATEINEEKMSTVGLDSEHLGYNPHTAKGRVGVGMGVDRIGFGFKLGLKNVGHVKADFF